MLDSFSNRLGGLVAEIDLSLPEATSAMSASAEPAARSAQVSSPVSQVPASSSTNLVARAAQNDTGTVRKAATAVASKLSTAVQVDGSTVVGSDTVASVANLLVMMQAVLDPYLQSTGVSVQSFVSQARTDLALLAQERRLVERLDAPTTGAADAKAVALARISGSIDRLGALTDAMIAAVGEVRMLSSRDGIDTDCDETLAELQSLRDDLQGQERTAAPEDDVGATSGDAQAAVAAVVTDTARYKEAVKTLTASVRDASATAAVNPVKTQDKQKTGSGIDTARDTTDAVLQSPASGAKLASTVIGELIKGNDRTNPAQIVAAAPTPSATAPASVIQPKAAATGSVADGSTHATAWLAGLVREFGSLPAAARHFGLTQTQLERIVCAVDQGTFDPLTSVGVTPGGHAGQLFEHPDLAFQAFTGRLGAFNSSVDLQRFDVSALWCKPSASRPDPAERTRESSNTSIPPHVTRQPQRSNHRPATGTLHEINVDSKVPGAGTLLKPFAAASLLRWFSVPVPQSPEQSRSLARKLVGALQEQMPDMRSTSIWKQVQSWPTEQRDAFGAAFCDAEDRVKHVRGNGVTRS